MLKSFTLFCFLIFTTSALFAGTIKGTVSDTKGGTPLSGVLVSVKGGGAVTETDSAGNFIFKDMPDGKYELILSLTSFKDETVTATVSGETPVTVNTSMKGDSHQLSGRVVKATRITRTESAVVLEIKKSSVAVSGISAAQISKTQDRNAADVVKRIPGVTIQEDRFITIRGLADRYNTVWLNDAGAPSSEVDKKAFSFDLIPSGLIDRILVFKTPAADLPGDFAGGTVKIYTTAMPGKTEYNLNIQGSYRSGSTGTDFNAEPTHSGDALGFDNGSRNIPAAVPSTTFAQNSPGVNISEITKSFGNDWKYSSKVQSPDLRVSGSAANLFKMGSLNFGNTFGFSYANTKTNYNVQRYDYGGDTVLDNHFSDKESIRKINLAVMENLAATIGNTKIEFRNLYNQIGVSTVTERTSVLDQPDLNDYKAYQLAYENRKTYAGELSGSHHNDKDTRKYNWTLGYSDINRNQPDLRRLWYERINGGDYLAKVTSYGDVDLGGGRVYTALHEKLYSFSHQFTQKFNIGNEKMLEVNLGNYVEYKDRDFSMRQLAYTIFPGQQAQELKKLPVDQIFGEQNIGDQNQFLVTDQTNPYDRYSATNRLIASFISVNVPITDRFKALIGLRYENNIQHISGVYSVTQIDTDFKTNFLLPSANLTYNFTAKTLLRLAYGKTVSRPEFREQAPFYSYDFYLNAGSYGALYLNHSLAVAEVQNIDARWEFYPSAGELIHAGVFYKSFKNPIQRVFASNVAGSGDFTFINGTKAYVAGLEIDVRKNLMFLDDKLGTSFMKNLVLVGNVAVSKSQLTVDSVDKARQDALTISKGPFEGQSNFVINTGLFYQNDSLGFIASLLYNYYSPRAYALGYNILSTGVGSIGEAGFHSLDFNLSKVFVKHYTLTLGVQNLLDQQIRLIQDTNLDNKFDVKTDKPFRNYSPGRYFTVGVKIRF